MGRVLVQQPGTNTAKALSETLPKNVIIVDEDLKELRLHDGVTPGGKIIGQNTGSGIPVGTIIPFAGNSVPQGYLLCDGSAISRTDYASLFAVIGTIYGAGDGNSTFNLPGFGTGGTIIYGTPGLTENGGIPNITGIIQQIATDGWLPQNSGVFEITNTAQNSRAVGDRGFAIFNMKFDASRVSSVYNDSTKVYASGLKMWFIIKYI